MADVGDKSVSQQAQQQTSDGALNEGKSDQPQHAQSFEEFGLCNEALRKLKSYRCSTPTDVQALVLNAVPLQDHLAIIAPRSQGKSTAAALAAVNTIDFELDKVQVLYVTYETSAVTNAYYMMQGMSPNSALKAYRAMPNIFVQQDARTLFRTVNHAVIGVPRRMSLLVQQRATDFSAVKLVILDQVEWIFTQRRLETIMEMLHDLPASVKVLLLARGGYAMRAISDFVRDCMGGVEIHRFNARQRRASAKDDAVSNMVGFPNRALKWAVLTTATEETLSEQKIRTYFDEFVTKMRGLTIARSTLQLDAGPTFVERAKDVAKAKEWITAAQEQQVDVLLYPTPLHFSTKEDKGDVLLFAEMTGVTMHAVRMDLATEQANAPVRLRFAVGHLHTLLGAYRRVLARKEGKLVERYKEGDKAQQNDGKSRATRRGRRMVVTSKEVFGVDHAAGAEKKAVEENTEFYVEGPKTLEFRLLASPGAGGDASTATAKLQLEFETDSNVFHVVLRNGCLVWTVAAAKEDTAEGTSAQQEA